MWQNYLVEFNKMIITRFWHKNLLVSEWYVQAQYNVGILGSITIDMVDLSVTIIPANKVNTLQQSLHHNLLSELYVDTSHGTY